jgi:AbrB family looped-hinge helix DNA binding protein
MKVTEKGQVTIPQPVREALGIGQGSEVEFEVKGDHAAIAGIPLLTRDPARIRAWYPTVRILEP